MTVKLQKNDCVQKKCTKIYVVTAFLSERIKKIADNSNEILRKSPKEKTALLKLCFMAIQPTAGPTMENNSRINKLRIERTVALTSDVQRVFTCSLRIGVAKPLIM